MHALVVGCGLTGAVIARQLAEDGFRVVIWDRRDHIGGNMFDYVDKHGILVHKYGPHTFHTSKVEIFNYVSRFSEWVEFKLRCGAIIDGICTPTPFNFKTIDTFYSLKDAQELKLRIAKSFPGRSSATVLEVLESQDRIVRQYAEFLFEKDYRLYTAKQWGIAPGDIDPSILKRVPLRFNYNEGYFDDAFQVMPKKSYAEFFNNLLNHKNIKVELGIEATNHLSITQEKKILINDQLVEFPVIYTGALDQLFNYSKGVLPYRSLKFEWMYEEKPSFQPYPVVAYPQSNLFTRIVEFKKLPVQNVIGTSYEIEYPIPHSPKEGTEPFYPLLTEDSKKQYEQYSGMASQVKMLFYCGRLADFKYYNMDQALQRALEIAEIVKTKCKWFTSLGGNIYC